MKQRLRPCFLILWMLPMCFYSSDSKAQTIEDPNIISYVVNLKKQTLKFFHKNDLGTNFGNFQSLRETLEASNQKLRFAMNGGMYLNDGTPQGLYIENGEILKDLDTTKEAYGNFYLQPNGIFYFTKYDEGVVCKTSEFELTPDILYATQSGPMLVINSKIHSAFVKGSKNLHIRNGVGILPNGHLLFAMSKDLINLYDFVEYFQKHGCNNALYLDGYVSRMFLPEKNWEQLDGQFGVIIAEIEQ
ncbi:MAG: hypothetical protein GYB32_02075 [Algicola sp.]|nr:hypothetical protein [Algicola sp.]